MSARSPRTPNGESFVLVADIEATGTNGQATVDNHSILEFGAVLCRDDADLTVVADVEMLCKPLGTPADIDLLWSRLDPVVQQMHTDNGLWAAVTDPHDPPLRAWEVDLMLGDWLTGQVGPHATVVLAGSGVSHYDDPWLTAQMPWLRSRLAYFTIDAGVLRRALQYARRDDLVDLVTDVDAKPHRGLGDARLHRAELVRYMRLLQQIPADPKGL